MTEEGGWCNYYWISFNSTDLSSLPQYNLCAHEFEQKVLKPKAKPLLNATPLKNDAKHRDSIFLAKPAYV